MTRALHIARGLEADTGRLERILEEVRGWQFARGVADARARRCDVEDTGVGGS